MGFPCPAQDGKCQRWLAKLMERKHSGEGAAAMPVHPPPHSTETGTRTTAQRQRCPHPSRAPACHRCLQAIATNPTKAQMRGEAKQEWNQTEPWKGFQGYLKHLHDVESSNSATDPDPHQRAQFKSHFLIFSSLGTPERGELRFPGGINCIITRIQIYS